MKQRIGVLALLALSIFSTGCCGWGWRCEDGHRWGWHRHYHDR
jgi:hypothetical protein